MSYLSIIDSNGDQKPMGLEVIFPSLTPVHGNWVGNSVLYSRPYGSTTPLPLNLNLMCAPKFGRLIIKSEAIASGFKISVFAGHLDI